jgi:hypothetical protein
MQSTFTRREWLWVAIVILVVLAVTAIPYLYAYRSAPANKHFMGIVATIPDHFQYFSWMRESRDKILVPNQLTPEYSTPLLFNFLWWTLGRIQAVTGIDYRALYQITRLLAGAFVFVATYWFCGLVFTDRTKRWLAFLVAVLGAGLGWLLVVEKFIRRLPDVSSPFAIYTSEPNTFYNVLAFPHFAIAAGLITVVFGLVLLGQRSQQLRYAWAAAAVALFLGVQHAYDMFIIYPVIGLYGLFVWLRDRQFPLYLFKLGVIVVLISMWPALQAFYITQADAVWKGVLSQFDNAGAWSPAPWLLPILLGIPWLLAIWALDIRTPWRDRDDTHLFILAWFGAHVVLVYLPLNFQIHLFSGWQVPIGILAAIGLYRRVLPWLRKRLPRTETGRLARLAAVALVIVVMPTNLYILAWRLLDMRAAWQDYDARPAENRHFLRTSEVNALGYLEKQVKGDDVVLASLDIGQFVPALTGARTFIGHWAQTLKFNDKRTMVNAFFTASTADAERQTILRQYKVSYVIFSPEETKLGGATPFDPATASYLTEVFADGDTKVYKVSLSQTVGAEPPNKVSADDGGDMNDQGLPTG